MKIYNSLSRTKEDFVTIQEGRVGMYVCGPTVYDEPHIGHARSAYIFDVIRRFLIYKGYRVTFVRNVTDVDDKIIDKAKKEYANDDAHAAVQKVVRVYLDSYHEAMDALGIGRPDHEPRATEYIDKMKRFIQTLIERGVAYIADRDVYFDITKAKGYGKLSNQDPEKMEAGARVAPGEKKRDPLDFALWKAAKELEPSWASPWGEGRPGWHIECSVMSSDILGDEFDIHCGGIDLIFPHHENEIAQSEGAGKRFARYWMHNGLLTINNEKMAKSLGNFITIRDFVHKNKDLDYLKLLFLSAHYRSPVDYTDEKIEGARKSKEKIGIFLRYANNNIEKYEKVYNEKPNLDQGSNFITSMKDIKNYKENIEKAMDDDFNMPQAAAEIFNIVHSGNSIKLAYDDKSNDLIRYLKLKYARDIVQRFASDIFGLFLNDKEDMLLPIERKIYEERNHFRQIKDYKKADEFRQILLREHNIILEDTKEGTVWRRKI